MPQRPPITISQPDFDRLSTLLQRHPDSEVVDELREELDRATLVAPDRMPPAVVAMNSRVRFRTEAGAREHTVALVYPHEVQDMAGRLSVLTPAGAALLGLAVGDCIEWPVADGRTLRLQVVDVLAQDPVPTA